MHTTGLHVCPSDSSSSAIVICNMPFFPSYPRFQAAQTWHLAHVSTEVLSRESSQVYSLVARPDSLPNVNFFADRYLLLPYQIKSIFIVHQYAKLKNEKFSLVFMGSRSYFKKIKVFFVSLAFSRPLRQLPQFPPQIYTRRTHICNV